MSKRQRQSDDGGIEEETQCEEDLDLRNFDKLFKQFQLEREYPPEKLDFLACPIYKLHPEKYRSRVGSCQGWGFKDYKELNEHIERTHKPLDLEDPKKRDSGKNQVPKIENPKAYQAWDQHLRSKRRTGTKKTPEYVRQKWWDTVKALELMEALPNPLPEDEHFAFPGPELKTMHLFLKWVFQQRKSPIAQSDVVSMAAANTHAVVQMILGTDAVPATRMTAAEKLNDRPKAEEVNYVAPPGDSGYSSLGMNDDRTDEETANLADTYPENTSVPCTGKGDMDEYLRGTGSKLHEGAIDPMLLLVDDERWKEWPLYAEDDNLEQDFSHWA